LNSKIRKQGRIYQIRLEQATREKIFLNLPSLDVKHKRRVIVRYNGGRKALEERAQK
jgi:hypothetical protein